MSEVKNIEYIKKSVGRPKKVTTESSFDKKAYMKNYMREYNSKNKKEQYNRRNTSYYVKRLNIPDDIIKKYGIYTAAVCKSKECLDSLNNDCPAFLEDIKEYIKELQLKKNHVADLSGVEVLAEIN